MLAKLRPRLTYANVVSTICLCLVVGGGSAYAANTIFSADIVDGQVKTVDLANGAVTVAKLTDGSITGDKVKDGALAGRDVLDNSLRGADIDESTLSNIGGGGPAGGDLAGTYPNPQIRAGVVGGAEVNESTLGTVPSAQNADKLDGKDAAQLASGRIHMHPPMEGFTDQFPVPGMQLEAECHATFAQVFIVVDDPGTANAMIGGRGVDPDPTEADFFETRNDVHVDGLVLQEGFEGRYQTDVVLSNEAGSAQSESQIVVDAGGKTYSLALHIFTQDAGAYCEFLGTATVTD